jgi:hypothetical protein
MKQTLAGLVHHLRKKMIHEGHHLALALAAFIAITGPVPLAAATATAVNTKQYAVGALCLSSLPIGAVTKGASSEQDGWTWEDYRIQLHPHTANHARLTIYDAPIKWSSMGNVDCSKTPEKRSVVLAGTINYGTLSLSRATQPGQDAHFQIDPKSIDLELGHVTVNPQRLFGGTVSFQNRRVWLYNQELIRIDSGKESIGHVVMEVTDVALQDAQLQLSAGATPMQVTLRADKNVFFSYGLADATLALTDGTMWVNNVTLPVSHLQLAGLAADSATFGAARLEFQGGAGAVRVAAQKMQLDTSEVTHGPAPSVHAALAGPLSVRRLTGTAAYSRDVAIIMDPNLEGVKATATALDIRQPGGGASMSGAATIDFAHLDPASWEGTVTLSAPSWPVAETVIPALTLRNLELHVAGPKDSSTFSGGGLLAAVRAGGLGLTELAHDGRNFSFGPSSRSGTVSVPFELEGQATTGHLTLDEPGRGQIGLTGDIDRLAVRGSIDVGEAMVLQRVLIPQNGLDIACRAAAAARPLLYGSKPSFAGAKIALNSMTDVSLTPGESSGKLRVSADALVLPDPELAFDQGRFRLNAPLQTSVAVVMDYGVADGRWRLYDGALDVTGVNARTIGDTPVEFDQLSFAGATLQLERLALTAHQAALNGQAKGFRVTASTMAHGDNPRVGCKAADLSLGDLEIDASQDTGALVVTNVIGHDLHASLRGIDYTSKDGFAAHGDATLTADAFTRDDVDKLVLDIPAGEVNVTGAANGRASLVGFHLAASGPKSALRGDVKMRLRQVAINVPVGVPVDPSCGQVAMHVSASLGDLDFDGKVTDGSLSGSLNLPKASIIVGEDAPYHCEFNHNYLIKDSWVLFSVPCGMDGWNVKMCDVRTDPIRADVHWTVAVDRFDVSADLNNTTVRLEGANGIKACGGQLTNLVGPSVRGAYVPSFNHDIPFISDVINGFIVATAYVFESSLVNTLGTAATLMNIVYKPQLLGGC